MSSTYERIARAKLGSDLEHALMEEDAAYAAVERDAVRAVKSARAVRERVRKLLSIIGQSLDSAA